MGIYLPNMEMPTNCCECFAFKSNASGQLFCKAKRIAFGKDDAEWLPKRTPNWCPLVPVPPHGDLISRSELDMSFTALRFNGNELVHWGDRKDWCLHGSEIENLINDAPTVIEAKEED